MSEIATTGAPKSKDTAFFGHPRGLSTLFFTEMWERFSYYGMRAFLVLFLTASVEQGGIGWSDSYGSTIVGIYMSLVYLMSLPGGWIADRFLGQRKAVLLGGTLIMCGHISLAFPTHVAFYLGLGLIVLGTGLLKPNVSAMVGQLYGKEDVRRSAGYAIFYMGINVGAFAAPIVTGFLVQSDWFRAFLSDHGISPTSAWHFGFAAAAVCMFFGLIQYVLGWKYLGDVGMHPTVPEDPARARRDRKVLAAVLGVIFGVPIVLGILFATGATALTPKELGDGLSVVLILTAIVLFIVMYRVMAADDDEKKRVVAMMVLFVGCLAFFALFDQASTTLTLFADNYSDNSVAGVSFPSSWWQFVNPAWILILSPFFGWMWLTLAKRKREPASASKFAIGMVFCAASFAVVLPSMGGVVHHQAFDMVAYPGATGFFQSAVSSHASHYLVSPHYLLWLYFFSTVAELFISPVGLSSMSKLAPQRMAGMVMGVWFLAISIGDYFAGRAESVSTSLGSPGFFGVMTVFSLAVAAGLFLATRPLTRLLGRKE
jgi:proton-dependent oligopeptide transporter, POT family